MNTINQKSYDNSCKSAFGIRPILLRSDHLKFDKQHYFSVHVHNTYEAVMVKSGAYACRVNGCPLRLKKNQLLLLKPGDQHEDFCEPGLVYSTVLFDLAVLPCPADYKTMLSESILPAQQIFTDRKTSCYTLAGLMQGEMISGNRFKSIYIEKYLLEFFCCLMEIIPEHLFAPAFLSLFRRNDFISALYRIFDEHIDSDLSLPEMAAGFGLSESSVRQKCRQYLKTAPSGALRTYKVRCAAQLLKNSSLTIKEISARFGFANQYHFSRVFKKIRGISPKAEKTSC
ncbi:MAG TPA: hypothetical protein DC049_17860 [Spirochaetia bacterium]|nr:hypothetical protein [Spirochaetia bacterium]